MKITARSLLAALVLLAAPVARAAEAGSTASANSGVDFIADARLLYRVVACTGDDPLPAGLDAKVVAEHCKGMAPKMKRYTERYVGEAKRFIGALRPAGVPNTVVYPFGGGDLISVLTTYPDANDITTLSLEYAGDPRRLEKISSKKLAESLAQLRRQIWGLLMADNSTTENLQKGQHGEIPGQLAFFMVALAVQGYEPVSLRYFRLEPDGTPHYLTTEEIAGLEANLAKTLRGSWSPPDSSIAFSNMELTFKPRGSNGPVRVHRHFGADLSDAGLAANPALVKYLEARGRISAMTKAASYLLWRDDFGTIRNYLLNHMEFMISDSTGIPPSYVRKAGGWETDTYGQFVGSFLKASDAHNADFRALWKSNPPRKLGFRYGYIDAGGNYHMYVVRKAAAPGGAGH